MCVSVLRATAGVPVNKHIVSHLANMEGPVWTEIFAPALMATWDLDVKSWCVAGTVKTEESVSPLTSANVNRAGTALRVLQLSVTLCV